jgi:hypothetical protein
VDAPVSNSSPVLEYWHNCVMTKAGTSKLHLRHMLKCLQVQLDGAVEQYLKTVMEENSAYPLT